MKKIRITLTKEGAQAACVLTYRRDDWPSEVTWTGNLEACQFPDGSHIGSFGGIDQLARIAPHYAELCGATCEIEDLGGEAITWRDEIEDDGTE